MNFIFSNFMCLLTFIQIITMKKFRFFFTVVVVGILITAFSLSTKQVCHTDGNITQDTLVQYRDGIYEGQSRADYTDESYWGKVSITVKNGLFRKVHFVIRDSSLHETFSDQYKVHFKGNPEYMQQCLSDWKGVKKYPKKLKKTRDIRKVDAITGATWSYHIFRASLDEALKKAVKK
jgi:major membrane immunogen (membrane-anchored lipoprotein)